MKNLLLLFSFVTSVFFTVQAQVNTIKVKRPNSNADTLIYYQVRLRTIPGRTKGDDGVYFINDSSVSKATFMKYSASRENIGKCVPCYLKTLDINDNVIGEGLQYTDCRIGSWKEYYPDGKIKRTGDYQKNLTDKWSDLYKRGYCSVMDGEWNYFNEKGVFLYSELWKEGEFINQVPEQDSTEIWGVDLKYNGFKLGNRELQLEQIKDLTVEPKFKNKTRENVSLKIKFEISAIGFKPVEQIVPIDAFKNINVEKMLADAGMSSALDKRYTLSIYNNEKPEASYSLKIRQ